MLFAIATAGIILLTGVGYWRGQQDDPGLTTEIALIVTTLLGGLSMQNPALAAGLAVTVACVLAARLPLHRFVRFAITEDELKDALIFAGATLVVLPLLPDRPMGPYGALNPHSIWVLVIFVMAIGAAGHLAVRILGLDSASLSPVSPQVSFQAPQLSQQWVLALQRPRTFLRPPWQLRCCQRLRPLSRWH